MRSVHKKSIIILFVILLCFIYVDINKKEAYAGSENNYLVLIQQKNGFWKEYTNLIETSNNGYLMIKAFRISKALGFTYEKNSNGTFVIQKSDTIYNTYTKNTKDFTYTNGAVDLSKMAPEKAYISKLSDYNLCQINSLNTLVYYKCFNSAVVDEYSSYDGIVCFSKYNDIPESVPIVETKHTKDPTPTPEPEPSSLNIEGVEFPVRADFLAKDKALSDWGGAAILWSELEQEVDCKIIKSTNLCFDSNRIEFTHLGIGCDGVSLTKADKGYNLSISVKLYGSVVADQNASIVKAMIATISSEPSLVYEAVFESFTTNETHGINEDTFVIIGDCKLKVNMKDGIVTYFIR
ncbi:MAG: hypothetical protein K0S76_346 [Herbinix sp.]|jgi:ABC-type cobalt transport system substrate-binding protein|nr:hypothetical protein [Herbinix sp.]